MAGQYPDDMELTDEIIQSHHETYISNLKYTSARLELENITGLIEPISTLPNYFLSKTDQALEILKELDCPNIRLQLDLFHHQRTHGNITETITANLDKIGHIQISQVPDRNEPNDNNGELNFNYIFNHLLTIGYKGWIGCEYIPSDSTTDLSWLEPYLAKV